MGNCPACLSGRYSTIHDVGSEEGDVDQKVGELGRSSGGGIKVVRVTDGKVFEYKTAASGSDDDDDGDIDGVHMQRLRAKDVISKVQGTDKGGLLYAMFDQSHSMMDSTGVSNRSTGNEKKKRGMVMMQKQKKKKDKGYDSNFKPLHPETLLKIRHVYYLRPASSTATTANHDHNVLSNISSSPASARAAAAVAEAATDDQKKKNEKKKVKFSDQVVFIDPPAPSSDYNHHQRQLDCILPPHTQPIDERQVAVKGPALRVKVLLSKRELCDLLIAAGDQYHHQQQHGHHSQLMAPADVFAEKSAVPSLLPHLAKQLLTFPQPSSLLSYTDQLIHITS